MEYIKADVDIAQSHFVSCEELLHFIGTAKAAAETLRSGSLSYICTAYERAGKEADDAVIIYHRALNTYQQALGYLKMEDPDGDRADD